MTGPIAATFAGYTESGAEVVDEQGRVHQLDAALLEAAGLRRVQVGQSLVVDLDAGGVIRAAALPGGPLG